MAMWTGTTYISGDTSGMNADEISVITAGNYRVEPVIQRMEPDFDFQPDLWVEEYKETQRAKPGGHIPWDLLPPEQHPDEESFFHYIPPVVPKVKPDVYTSPGYLPPQLHESDPGRLDPDPPGFWPEFDLTPGEREGLPWIEPESGLDLTPGPGGGMPWTDPDGGFDFTPGSRGGLPWTDDEGKLDLTPGAGTGILGFDIPDLSNLLPIMLLAMVVKER
jgi:hypothetical protein